MWSKTTSGLLLSAFLLGVPLTAACETKLVGMTAQQYFGDTLEARLALAAGQGDVEEVKRLVARGANVNATGDKNLTPLGWALFQKNPAGMRALLEAGADPNQPVSPKKHLYPVWVAAGLDNPELLKVLLEFKGDPNVRTRSAEYSALSRAARSLENVRLLVEAGADVNTADSLGHPFVVDAAALKEYDIVMYMLEKGFSRNLPLLAWEVNDRRPDGRAPVSPSLEPKRLQVMAKLKQLGITPPEGPAPPLEANPPEAQLTQPENKKPAVIGSDPNAVL